MKVKKYDWQMGDALPGPCMVCEKATVECHGDVSVDCHGGHTTTIRLLLCSECAGLSDHVILEKLGFLPKRGADEHI